MKYDFVMEKRIWKSISGYEGIYAVSNFGEIAALDQKGNISKLMSPKDNGKGYKAVNLRGKMKYVHRLVAEAFIPNPNNYPCVNHKDESRDNNVAYNLEWCTYSYNSKYGTLPARKREHMIKLRGHTVQQYDLKGNLIKSYECTKDIDDTEFNRREVYFCCIGNKMHHKGFVWRFDNAPFSINPIRLVPVYKYDMNNNLICVYKSITEAEQDNKMEHHYIKNLRSGVRKNNIINGFKYCFNMK